MPVQYGSNALGLLTRYASLSLYAGPEACPCRVVCAPSFSIQTSTLWYKPPDCGDTWLGANETLKLVLPFVLGAFGTTS